jgi:hypothetical protein
MLCMHTVFEGAMEQWVRVQNEHDRNVLAWLRARVGDTEITLAAQACARSNSKPYLSAVCRHLGLSARDVPVTMPITAAVGDRHLAALYEILRSHPIDVLPTR